MNTYIDSSVVLRVLLRQPGALAEWKSLPGGVTSELAMVECLRTVDRLSHAAAISPADVPAVREAIYRIFGALRVARVTPAVLQRASQPLPAPLGTIDAVHLVTAQLFAEAEGAPVTIATHDAALALAARASGMGVIGV